MRTVFYSRSDETRRFKLPEKSAINELFVRINSGKQNILSLTKYGSFLRFTVEEENLSLDGQVTIKALVGSNLDFSSQECVELEKDFNKLCKEFFEDNVETNSNKIFLSTKINPVWTIQKKY